MPEINTMPELIAHLKERFKDIQQERKEYDNDHPEGAERVEDNMTEAGLSAAEGEIATLLTLVGVNPYPGE